MILDGIDPSDTLCNTNMTNGDCEFISTERIPASTWTHIAATYDGATFTLYRNDANVLTVKRSGHLVPSTRDLRIGSDAFVDPDTKAIRVYVGVIDDVRIYSRALSLDELRADENTPIAPP
jgi:hypothetical protein